MNLWHWHKRPARPARPTLADPDQSPELPYEIATRALDRQMESIDSLDAKTMNVVIIAVAMIALLAAVLALRPEALTGATTGWFIAALVALGMVVLCAAIAVASRQWFTGPKAQDIISDFRRGIDEPTARWKATRCLIGSVDENQRLIRLKGNLLRASFALFAAEILFVMIALVRIAH